MGEEDVVAAVAELDQANAAMSELQAQFDELTQAAAAAEQQRQEQANQAKEAVRAANAALQPVDVEMEKRRGAVRTAQAKLAAAQAGEEYVPPETQGVE